MNIDIKLDTRILTVKTDAAGKEVWRGETKNIITNNGLLAFVSNAASFFSGNMYLSTSTAAPAAADVAMGGTTVTSGTASTLFPSQETTCSATGLMEFKLGRKFSTAGTYGSVGLGSNATTGICSKALLRDTGGNPTTVTLLPGESLDVQYILQYQIPTSLVTGTIGGVDYELFMWRGQPSGTGTWTGGGPIAPSSQWNAYGNTSATPAFSGTALDSTAFVPAGWTAATAGGAFNGTGDIAILVAAAQAGNSASVTWRIRVFPSATIPGNVIHGISQQLVGLNNGLAIRFPNTKPSKTSVQEFRWDVTFTVAR